MRWSCAASRRMFGALAALTDVTLTCGRASAAPCSAPTAPARRRCSTASPATFRRPREPIRFFGEDVTNFPPHERIRRGLRRTYQISAAVHRPHRCSTTSISPAAASRAGASRCSAPRAGDALMQSAAGLIEAVHLQAVSRSPGRGAGHGQQRQLEIALALAGAPRFILFDEPAAGLSPKERARADRDPHLDADAHRLHHHRARHGCRAARRRERDDDAQRPHLQGRPARARSRPIREVQELYLGGGHG